MSESSSQNAKRFQDYFWNSLIYQEQGEGCWKKTWKIREYAGLICLSLVCLGGRTNRWKTFKYQKGLFKRKWKLKDWF